MPGNINSHGMAGEKKRGMEGGGGFQGTTATVFHTLRVFKVELTSTLLTVEDCCSMDTYQ